MPTRRNKLNLNTPERTEELFLNKWKGELHYVDWDRFKRLVKFYQINKGRYLDIGCFNSPMPTVLKSDYPEQEIYAIDFAPKVIEELKRRHPEVNYLVGNANKLDFEDKFFDYIVAGEVLEHNEIPANIIKEAMRVLKPEGWLAISVPDNENQDNRVDDSHLWSFTSEDLINLLSPYGEVRIEYMSDTVNILIAFCQKKI